MELNITEQPSHSLSLSISRREMAKGGGGGRRRRWWRLAFLLPLSRHFSSSPPTTSEHGGKGSMTASLPPSRIRLRLASRKANPAAAVLGEVDPAVVQQSGGRPSFSRSPIAFPSLLRQRLSVEATDSRRPLRLPCGSTASWPREGRIRWRRC